MIPAPELDQMISSFCSAHWQKVAKIVGNTFKALEQRGVSINGAAEKVDERIAVLVGSGRLEARGNVKRWRYGEVRLPDGTA
jgi:biotin-(acetyl-CoA carboxylase) ligase